MERKKKEEMFIENAGVGRAPFAQGGLWVAALLLRTIPQSDVESQNLAVALDLQGDGVAHLLVGQVSGSPAFSSSSLL